MQLQNRRHFIREGLICLSPFRNTLEAFGRARHRAVWDRWPHTRAGTRVTVKGERPA
jgi:hypothetical protein